MKAHRKRINLEIRPIPLWSMLICGIIIILIGIYLYSTNSISGGNLPVGTRNGNRFLRGPIIITGTSTIIVGIAICIFPIYQLIKNSYRKKTDS